MGTEQQTPVTVWCGKSGDQDVSIRLVAKGINQQQVANLCRNCSQEPLAVFKVHSTRLKKHNKYFQACLSTRWTGPDAPPSIIFNLELIHGLQVASYTDCFSRLYTPGGKNFKDVKTSLELLLVASQIEFSELVKSICGYLSNIPWSEEDELGIRKFSHSQDFPKSQAGDLVTRLKIGEPGKENACKKLVSQQIVECIQIALRQSASVDTESVLNAQSMFEDLFSNIRQSETDSAFENDVVTIVSKEVKAMLESFHEDCAKHASFYKVKDMLESFHENYAKHATDASGERRNFHEVTGETAVVIDFDRVSGFRGKLKALCWALELLLKTQVAEEVIKCWLHLEFFFPIITSSTAQALDCRKPASENVALRFCKLVIVIFQEVVAGRLLLEIPDRVLLIKDWQWISSIHDLDTENEILMTWGFKQALKGVFLTLPLEQQMELLQHFFHPCVHRQKLACISDEKKLASGRGCGVASGSGSGSGGAAPDSI